MARRDADRSGSTTEEPTACTGAAMVLPRSIVDTAGVGGRWGRRGEHAVMRRSSGSRPVPTEETQQAANGSSRAASRRSLWGTSSASGWCNSSSLVRARCQQPSAGRAGAANPGPKTPRGYPTRSRHSDRGCQPCPPAVGHRPDTGRWVARHQRRAVQRPGLPRREPGRGASSVRWLPRWPQPIPCLPSCRQTSGCRPRTNPRAWWCCSPQSHSG